MAEIVRHADGEEWRAVVGYEGRYEVSSLGRVRSLVRRKVRIMTPTPRASGYLGVTLRNHPAPVVTRTVHTLVLNAFRGPKPTPEHQSAHDDGVGTNNRLTNLFWKTPAENSADRERHGTWVRGERQHLSKLTAAQVLEIRRRAPNERYVDLAAEFGVVKQNISQIVNRRTWKHV